MGDFSSTCPQAFLSTIILLRAHLVQFQTILWALKMTLQKFLMYHPSNLLKQIKCLPLIGVSFHTNNYFVEIGTLDDDFCKCG